MSIKAKLRDLLAEGKTEKVIALLLHFTKKDGDLHNDTIRLSARYKNYKRERLNGIGNLDQLGQELNRINEAALDLIERLDENIESTKKRYWVGLWLGIIASIMVITGFILKNMFPPGSNGSEETEFYLGFDTIEFNDVVWMAENLNYPLGNSNCCKPKDCGVTGRLYTWEEAKQACDKFEGWRLPSYQEWKKFLMFLTKEHEDSFVYILETQHVPKIGEISSTSHVKDAGKNAYSNLMNSKKFNVVVSGILKEDGDCIRYKDNPKGGYTAFWTDTELNDKQAYNFNLNSETNRLEAGHTEKFWGYSCRCVTDKD